MEFKDLIGKKVTKILMDHSKTRLIFETETGNLGYRSYGDCCSYSWFEHFDGIEILLNETVIGIEDKDIPTISKEEHNEKGYDSLEQYGWTFKTSKGRATLEMRNDSNGYYGGSVEKDTQSIAGTKEITKDF